MSTTEKHYIDAEEWLETAEAAYGSHPTIAAIAAQIAQVHATLAGVGDRDHEDPARVLLHDRDHEDPRRCHVCGGRYDYELGNFAREGEPVWLVCEDCFISHEIRVPGVDLGPMVARLIPYLDARLEALGGYSLWVRYYTHARGEHRVEVMPLIDTPAQGQSVADALGLAFAQSDRWPYVYRATREDVEYVFHLDNTDTEDYPKQFTPAVSEVNES